MPTELFEKTYELGSSLEARNSLEGRWVWEYYGLEASNVIPETTALSSDGVRFVVRQTMTVVEGAMLTATNVEISVRSDEFVRLGHDTWHQEHLMPILDTDLGSSLAHSRNLQRRSFVESRTAWPGAEMRLRRYPLSGSGPASVSFVFETEEAAMRFQPPSWPSLLQDSVQERHVHSVEVADDTSPIEYEKRYLADAERLSEFKKRAQHRWIAQSYPIVDEHVSLRVRVIGDLSDNESARTGQIAVKGPRVRGARLEVQGVLPGPVASAFIRSDWPRVEKIRYSRVLDDGYAWEVDEFLGPNSPLHIAECEVNSVEELANIQPQDFCGQDVSDMSAYNNEMLAIRPVSAWSPGT